MDYTYNYKFLGEWMKANQFGSSDVLSAIGTQAFASVRSWSNGLQALPLNTLLRICNTFQIPLEQFFLDRDDNTPAYRIRHPKSEEETMPVGGYKKDKEHDKRNHKPIDPKAHFIRPTVIPDAYPLLPANESEGETPTLSASAIPEEGSCKPSQCEGKESKENEGKQSLSDDEATVLVLKTELKCQQRMSQQQEEARKREDDIRSEFLHRNEKLRDKLYAIIEAQQQTIARQQQTIDRQQQAIDRQQSTITALSTKKAYPRYPDEDTQIAAEPDKG